MRWVAVAVVVWVGWWAFVVSHAIIARAGHTKKKTYLFLSLSTNRFFIFSFGSNGKREPAASLGRSLDKLRIPYTP